MHQIQTKSCDENRKLVCFYFYEINSFLGSQEKTEMIQ